MEWTATNWEGLEWIFQEITEKSMLHEVDFFHTWIVQHIKFYIFQKKNITVTDPEIRVLLDQHDLLLVYFHKIERKLKDVFQKLKHDTITHHEYTLYKDPQVYEKIDILEQHAQKIQIIHYRHFPQEQNDIWLGFVFQWTESL